jgi:hypothetical protein
LLRRERFFALFQSCAYRPANIASSSYSPALKAYETKPIGASPIVWLSPRCLNKIFLGCCVLLQLTLSLSTSKLQHELHRIAHTGVLEIAAGSSEAVRK